MKIFSQRVLRSISFLGFALIGVSCAQSPSLTEGSHQGPSSDSQFDSTVAREKNSSDVGARQPLLSETKLGDPKSGEVENAVLDSLISATVDSDYDGRSDADELVEGTDPNDFSEYRPVRLSYWRFNGLGWYQSEEGYSSISYDGADNPPSFDGKGLMISNGAVNARFHVNSVGTNGHANINYRRGSISFMFKPDWSSNDGGPGHVATLFQAGKKGDVDYWVWQINSDGSEIQFVQHGGSDAANQIGQIVSSTAKINFKKGSWYRILIGWADGFSEVRINGVTATVSSRRGVTRIPSKAMRDGGFYVGSDNAGASKAQGTFDEIQIFNDRLFSTLDSHDVIAGASARIVRGDAIELRWRAQPDDRNTDLRGYRRAIGNTNWGPPLFEKTRSWSYVDTSPKPGEYYEYFLDSTQNAHHNDRFVAAAIRGRPIHHRGRVLLLVDETVGGPLSTQLGALQSDLVGDGWKVSRMTAPRHRGSSYKNDLSNLRSDLKKFAVAHGDLELIYIIGHVVIPYSGRHNPDGHGARPLVADGFYGDIMNEMDWGDRLELGGGNTANDGKLDQSLFPAELEFGVGRVDFANLPAFQKKSANPPLQEIDLLRNYLRRAHDYRHGILRFPDNASFYTTSGSALERIMAQNATRTAESLFGDDLSAVRHVNDFINGESYLWSFHGGTGAHSRAHTGNPSSETSTANLAEMVRFSNSGFYLVDGSFLGEWNRADSFLRGLLAKGNGLGSSWARGTRWRLHYLGIGVPIGSAVKHSINIGVSEKINYLKATYLSYLGDPTLRMQVLPSPSNISGAPSGKKLVLNWSHVPETDVHYFIYRSKNGLNGDFIPLNQGASISSNSLTFTGGSSDEMYQVRAAKLVRTGGGSFTNLSQAVFWP